MFESLKQNDRLGGIAYLASLSVSLAVHAVVLCLLVVVPLIFFNALQAQELLTFLVEPPAPPVQPPPSPPVKTASAVRQTKTTTPYDVPRTIPNGVPPADDAGAVPFDPGGIIAAIPGISGFGQTGGMGKGVEGLLTDPLVVSDPPKPPGKKPAPIRVGALESSKLIYKVNPIYPVIAVKAHIMGTVILEAGVDEEGGISAVKVLSGHPFLVDAAVQAVKQWKYSPTILNGEPVPVIATITVIFRLD
jgi:periplasmic protein TonB